jgi:hypothetical protein
MPAQVLIEQFHLASFGRVRYFTPVRCCLLRAPAVIAAKVIL